MMRRAAGHRGRCASCRYDLTDIDFARTQKCPECGKWISVRIGPDMPWYMAAALSLLMPVYLMACIGVFISSISLIAYGVVLALIPMVVLTGSVAVSVIGVHRLATRPLGRTATVLAWLAAMVPVLLIAGGCLLGVVVAMF